jgi:hypothetical protein
MAKRLALLVIVGLFSVCAVGCETCRWPWQKKAVEEVVYPMPADVGACGPAGPACPCN